MSTIVVDDVHVSLGSRAILRGVSATFNAGAVTAIIGPNGAGKSTLMWALAGLRKPDAGHVLLDGADAALMPPRLRARRIGLLPQNPEIAWAVDARTLVGLGRTPFLGARGPGLQDNAAVERAMVATDTHVLADRDVTTLSGGERARVLIARVLAGEPDWLLADEPLTGLDPGHQLDAALLLRRLAKDEGRGVIVTLHDLHMALRIADRIVVLAEGRVLADAPAAQALTVDVLARAYQVDARFTAGQTGPLIEILGKR